MNSDISSSRQSTMTLADYQRLVAQYEDQLLQGLLIQLRTLNLLPASTPISTPSSIPTSQPLSACHQAWLAASIEFLCRHYDCTAAQLSQLDAPSAEQWQQQWQRFKQQLAEQWRQYPALMANVDLVESMLQQLPEVLSGQRAATDILFPGSSMAKVQGIYTDNPVADYFNAVLVESLLNYVQQRLAVEPSAQLRLVEIGAGTGGTSRAIFAALQPFQHAIANYTYTDLSQAFLSHGKQQFAEVAPYLTTQIFNAEIAPAQQGLPTAHYDVLIATNVLHATRNIEQTLQNAKSLLKPHGLMLLNEISAHGLATHLTFGLLEGWWLFDDGERRLPGGPGLSSDAWREVMAPVGLGTPIYPAAAYHSLGQQIIVAQSDGQIDPNTVTANVTDTPVSVVKADVAPTVPPSSGRQALIATLVQHLALALEVEENQIDLDEAFSDYGLDSILVVDLVDKLNQSLQLQLDSTTFFDYTTVNRLADYLLGEGLVVPSALTPASVARTPTVSESVQDKFHSQRQLQQRLIGHLARALEVEVDQIDTDAPFSDYGLDSILVVDLVDQLNVDLGIELDSTSFFDHTTVLALTDFIVTEYPQRHFHGGESQHAAVPVLETPSPLSSEAAPSAARDRLTETLAQTHAGKPGGTEAIAIIGISGRFAQSDNLEQLWQHLAAGHDLVTQVQRWDLPSLYRQALGPRTPEQMARDCHAGSFVDHIDQFDPLFFNMSGLEATYTDPQHRLFLQEAWHALEDAGYAGDGVKGSQCGVYVGASSGKYQELFRDNPPPQSFWGNAGSVIPARIAYHLDLQGPALAIDTACSSSLVAMHLACQALRQGEIDMALAGGVFLQSTEEFYVASNRAGMLSALGHCHAFDNRADGFVPGEGVGVVILKRLADAQRDGDAIRALILGSGINQDGASNGITAPSAKSQQRLQRQVYDEFGIDAGQIQMVEAHGTGTKLGDPIEFAALTRAFRQDTDKQAYCAIGSIKSNLGHTAMSAGVAGVLKGVLALQHQQIPPTLHYERGNSNIAFDGSPFYVNTELRDWPVAAGECRRVAVSSFGFSGTNAHLVLQQAPAALDNPLTDNQADAYLVVLSAQSSEQLQQQLHNLLAFCQPYFDGPEALAELPLAALSFTLLEGRRHCSHRWATVVPRQQPQQLLLALALGLAPAMDDTSAATALYLNSDDYDRCDNELASAQALLRAHTEAPVADSMMVLRQLAEAFCRGYSLPLADLFSGAERSRIALPVYPFSRDSYWVSGAGGNSVQVEEKMAAVTPTVQSSPHPLVQIPVTPAVATRGACHFASRLQGDEFYLAEHRFQQQRVLPGVAYIEMVRAALRATNPVGSADDACRVQIEQLLWQRPIALADDVDGIDIQIQLQPLLQTQTDGVPSADVASRYQFAVLSDADGSEPLLHCKGVGAVLNSAAPASLDLQVLQQRCQRRHIDGAVVYRLFADMDLNLGAGFQTIQQLQLGNEGVLAKLQLADDYRGDLAEYPLHPGLLDSALQSTLGLHIAARLDDQAPLQADQFVLSMPFVVDRVSILAPCQPTMWAWSRVCDGYSLDAAALAQSSLQKMDIDLCDEQGQVCVQWRGLTVQAPQGQADHSLDTSKPEHGVSMDNRSTVAVPSADLRVAVVADIQQLVAELLHVKRSQLHLDKELSTFGFDSISMTVFAEQLAERYGVPLAPTVFFEHPSIRAIGNYLCEQHRPALTACDWLGQSPTLARSNSPTAQPSISEVLMSQTLGSQTVAAPQVPPTASALSPDHAIKPLTTAVAIIGMSGRLPMADDIDRYWQNLLQGRDCISEVPNERWDWRAIYGDAKTEMNKTQVKWGGFMPQVDDFEPLFFGVSPVEAERMDPQQRLLMMYVWKAIEDAGYAPSSLAGTDTCLFAGTGSSGYHSLIQQAGLPVESYSATGLVPSVGPNRMSYLLDIHGPSEPVETACSSSLVAILRAYQCLCNGTSQLAIAGGVNVIVTPDLHIGFSKAGMLSDDGRCKTFAKDANGYVRGEGVGMLLMKPLALAERDGDSIYAVIRGGAENHGGRANSLTAPNVKAQVALLQQAYANAGVAAQQVGYIEAHGTGTPLGDPAEINGLTSAFAAMTPASANPSEHPCYIGSVKSNIGHLELAAGVAGVIKLVKQLQQQTLVQSLHCEQVNPYIQLQNSRFRLAQQRQPWSAPLDAEGRELPRCGGISSFGFGGANAHLVLQEYIPSVVVDADAATDPVNPAQGLFVLSARTRNSLVAQAKAWLAFIDQQQQRSLPDGEAQQRLWQSLYTLQVGRDAMKQRLAIVVDSWQVLQHKLTVFVSGQTVDGLVDGLVDDLVVGNTSAAAADCDAELQQLDLDSRHAECWQRGQLPALAQRWVRGDDVNWQRLYGDQRPQRLHLPSYCFERQRYWVAAAADAVAPSETSQTELDTTTEFNPVFETSASVVVGSGVADSGVAISEIAGSVAEDPVVADLMSEENRQEWLLAQPVWLPATSALDTGAERPVRRRVLLLGLDHLTADTGFISSLQRDLQNAGAADVQVSAISIDGMATTNTVLAQRFTGQVLQLMQLLQAEMGQPGQQSTLVQLVVAEDQQQQCGETGLAALLKTAAQEDKRLCSQLLRVPAALDGQRLRQYLLAESLSAAEDNEICYSNGARQVKRWQLLWSSQNSAPASVPTNASTGNLSHPWRNAGTYLITGGLGGLGYRFAEEIARHAERPSLILTGRSPLDEAKQQQCERLRQLGAEVDYRALDVADLPQTTQLIADINQQYGDLHGVLHTAGINDDNLLLRKSASQCQRVLAAKVQGCANLDLACQAQPLDLFVLFSSIAGAFGNPGQADYAAANGFMDDFSEQRQRWAQQGLRQGLSLSINWPYWRDGGMQVEPAALQIMQSLLGLEPLTSQVGMQAFYRLLALGPAAAGQSLVVAGDLERLQQRLLKCPDPLPSSIQSGPTHTASAPLETAKYPSEDISNRHPDASLRNSAMAVHDDENSLLEQTQVLLIDHVTGLLKVARDEVVLDDEFNEFGFDSITLTEFTNQLNARYGTELTPALFYECRTIRALSEHLLNHWRETLLPHLVTNPQRSNAVAAADIESIDTGVVQPKGANLSQGSLSQDSLIPDSLSQDKPSRASARDNAIAVIGMAGRFPMAADIDEFWHNLCHARDCISEVPAQRWDWQAVYGDPQAEHNKTHVKWGGFIDGVDEFDARFFGLSPREAQSMDPQQRLLMLYVWQAMEDAGYAASALAGSDTGIFVGTTNSGYGELVRQAGVPIESFSATGILPSVGPNRMSFLLDFHGPSEPIETSCSSALVAVHRAVRALRDGSCTMAIVGGINTILTPDVHIGLSRAGMLCADGRCKTFSDQANGYVRGEGVGMVVLKPLAEAEQDADHIYGVIRGSAENHGGRANSLTSPNAVAQASVIEKAYRDAAIDLRQLGYVEAHGTGTELGDPVEINGLKMALCGASDIGQLSNTCLLGSVKSNVGHLEFAAGIAGLIKVLLQMRHQTIVPTLHCETINPYIQLQDTPLQIAQQQQPWPAPVNQREDELPRCAGISSFGFGGVNAHVVVEEYVPSRCQPSPAQPPITASTGPQMVVLSARDSDALERRLQQLRQTLQRDDQMDLQHLAYTLQVGREAMPQRLALLVATRAELQDKLQALSENQASIAGVYRGDGKGAKASKGVLALFDDEDMQAAVGHWFRKGKFSKILDLWVKGGNIDWQPLYVGRRPQRLALPGYPFAKVPCWVSETKRVSPAVVLKTDQSILAQEVVEKGGLAQQPSAARQPVPVKPLKSIAKTTTKEASPSGRLPLKQISVDVPNKPNAIALSPLLAPSDQTRQVDLQPARVADPNHVPDKPNRLSLPSLLESHSAAAAAVAPVVTRSVDADTVTSPVLSAIVASQDTSTNQSQNQTTDQTPDQALEALEKIVENLTDSLADALFMERDEVDVDEALVDLGLDSVVGVEWIAAVNRHYGLEIAATQVYDYPTIASLAGLIESLLSSAGVDEQEVSAEPALVSARQSVGVAEVSVATAGATEAAGAMVEASADLLEALCSSLAEALFMEREELDPDETFVDLGLDSVVGVEWISVVNKTYHTDINATKVYDYPTPRALTQLVALEMAATSLPPAELPDEVLEPVSTTLDGSVSACSASELDQLQQALVASLAEALYLGLDESPIDIDDSFVDIGLDSVVGVEWMSTVNQHYGVEIPATKLYDYPTIRDLAGLIAEQKAVPVLQDHQPAQARSTVQPTEQPELALSNLSYDELLQQVHDGTIDIDEADELLQTLALAEGDLS